MNLRKLAVHMVARIDNEIKISPTILAAVCHITPFAISKCRFQLGKP